MSARRARLYQADFVRGTTFMLVILTHTLAATTDVQTNVTSNLVAMFLHLSRNAFFFLTGFVLTYANFTKSNFSATSFWPQRLRLVAIPYVVWSFVYWCYRLWTEGRLTAIPFSLNDFWHDLSRGLAAPHMYFLLVMLQVYLLFPALLWVLRKTHRHHGLLLGASVAIQITSTVLLTYWQPGGWLGAHWWQAFTTFVPYQLFVLMGCLVAIHRDEVDAWVRTFGGWLPVVLLATGTFATTSYFIRIGNDISPLDSSAVFRPSLLPFLATAVACLYALGVWWSDHRDTTPRLARIIDHTSNRSFSIFLVHVLFIDLLLLPVTNAGVPWLVQWVPAPWSTILTFAMCVVLTLAAVEILRRLPGSVYLTGRPRIPVRLRRPTLARASHGVWRKRDEVIETAR